LYSIYIHLGLIRVICANYLFLGQIVIFRANFFRSPSTMPFHTPMQGRP